jgi:hypothetical protein
MQSHSYCALQGQALFYFRKILKYVTLLCLVNLVFSKLNKMLGLEDARFMTSTICIEFIPP